MAGFARPVTFASADVPGTWRVVFSSTGDLVPAGVAVRRDGLPTRMWFEAARRSLRIAIDSAAAVLIPSDCRICAQALVRLSRIPVCDPCANSLAPADKVACVVCGEALEFGAVEAALCPMCQRAHPRFDFAISFAGYVGTLLNILTLLKYEHLRPATQLIGPWQAQTHRHAAFP